MGIRINNNKVLSLIQNDKNVLAVYINGELIWPEEIPSCFSNGYWIDEYPWVDDRTWVD